MGRDIATCLLNKQLFAVHGLALGPDLLLQLEQSLLVGQVQKEFNLLLLTLALDQSKSMIPQPLVLSGSVKSDSLQGMMMVLLSTCVRNNSTTICVAIRMCSSH